LEALAASKADPGLDEWDTSDTVMVVCMLFALGIFDWFVNPRIAQNSSHHVITLVFMLLASFIFGVFVWRQRGQSDGVAWLTGFVVEWALSMDNLFVFHLVFKAFSVPNDQSTRALGIGIYGAICFRMVFIVGLSELFTLHYAVDIAIGGLLITSGICSLSDSDDEEVHDLAAVKFFKWLLGSRLQDVYNEEGRLFTRNAGGELQLTVLFLVVCIISVVDCVFAVDSVGSKTGQIKNIYINVTSSLMAMFSLRSLFFIIRDLADYFDYVKYGICAILCFVGLEMMCQHWIHVPLGYMCVIITLLFSASLVASVLKVHTLAHLVDAGGKHSGDDKHEETSEDQIETRITSVLQPQWICQEVAPSQTSGQADDHIKEVKV
jgi:tellurite resistance protein TerC